jgi:hypothetical protein
MQDGIGSASDQETKPMFPSLVASVPVALRRRVTPEQDNRQSTMMLD